MRYNGILKFYGVHIDVIAFVGCIIRIVFNGGGNRDQIGLKIADKLDGCISRRLGNIAGFVRFALPRGDLHHIHIESGIARDNLYFKGLRARHIVCIAFCNVIA